MDELDEDHLIEAARIAIREGRDPDELKRLSVALERMGLRLFVVGLWARATALELERVGLVRLSERLQPD